MISILILAILLVFIAATLLYQSKVVYDKKICDLENHISIANTRNKIQHSVNIDLERAQLRYQQLNNKINGELDFWKKRRTMLPKVSKNTRKKKIRGKKQKGRK
jgi:hypothetical protein